MSLKILKLNAKNLGPIDRINLEFSDVNLIFGSNESGKTFLLEFLLKSLFKDQRLFDIRDFKFNGHVEVQGLNKQIVNFLPDDRSQKLEDYLSDTFSKLPKDLSKLLVVRAGELDFDNTPEGISETILKKYLSNEYVIEQIDKKISSSIKTTDFIDGDLVGKRIGENKKRLDKESELKKVQELLSEIDSSYSEGEIQILNHQLEQTKKEFNEIYLNKCKLAFILNKKSNNAIAEIEKLKLEIIEEANKLRSIIQVENQNLEQLVQNKKEILRQVQYEVTTLKRHKEAEIEDLGKIKYAINEKLRYLDNIRTEINLSRVESVSSDLRNFGELSNNRDAIEQIKTLLEEQLKPFEWLNNSLEVYQQCLGNKSENDITRKNWSLWPLSIISLTFLVITIVLLLLNLKFDISILGTVVLSIACVIIFVNTLLGNKNIVLISEKIKTNTSTNEINQIREHFSKVFETDLKIVDLPLIRQKRDELRAAEIKFINLKEEEDRVKQSLSELKNKIEFSLVKFSNLSHKNFDWELALGELRKKAIDIQDEYQKFKTFFDGLDISINQVTSSDYLEMTIEEIYSVYALSEKRIDEFDLKIANRKSFLSRENHNLDISPLYETNPIRNLDEWVENFDDFSQKIRELENNQKKIEDYLLDLQISNISYTPTLQMDSSSSLDDIKQSIKYIKNLIQDRESICSENLLKLAKLNVIENEFVKTENEEIVFDQVLFLELEKKKIELENEIENERINLENLRMKIIGAVQGRISFSFDELIKILKEKENLLIEEIDNMNSEILAGIFVTRVLKNLINDERENIKITLNSPKVTEPLFNLTGRYKKFILEDDGLSVKDDFNVFRFKDLSTGTREQIFLGLRLGFSSHLLENDQLFLLLDDAFQHSDWSRRENMIRQMFELATAGWQIIYFSMDDHIKSLFEKISKDYSSKFLSVDLSSTKIQN